jgi:Domain of unknown function (DUF4160)
MAGSVTREHQRSMGQRVLKDAAAAPPPPPFETQRVAASTRVRHGRTNVVRIALDAIHDQSQLQLPLGQKMPVVFREGGLRYFFFSNEGSPREPRHVHVKGAAKDAKVWLDPDLAIAESYGFKSNELAHILRIVSERRDLILKACDEHFSDCSSF